MIRRWNTRLARQLWAIRRRAIRAGERLLSEAEIDREVAERQGTLVEAEPMMKSNRGLVAEAGIGAVIIAVLASAVTCMFTGGCVTRLKDNGEVGLRMGYDIAFYHKTSRTDSEAEAEIKSQPLLDWLASGDEKPAGPPAPEPEAPNP